MKPCAMDSSRPPQSRSQAHLQTQVVNQQIPLSNADYDALAHERDPLNRQSPTARPCYSIAESSFSLVHLPADSVRSEKLHRERRRTKTAPSCVLDDGLLLGENVHSGVTRKVCLTTRQRLRHMYIIGATGTGKSTLLLNLMLQDAETGSGFAVLDPHGDLIDNLLGRIPESRFDDVIIFDPSDAEYPIGFNVLSAHSDLEKTLLASDLGAVFKRLSTSWGDQMTAVLGNAILAFLENERPGHLGNLRRFLVDKDFRSKWLPTCRDPEILFFWEKEFPLLTGRPQASILTRLDAFLRPKPIRHMVCQTKNSVDFSRVMNDGRILLVKLAQGAIGLENSYLLGALLVTKLHQMALSRQSQAENQRRPFYLYIDEFQNFITPSMAEILSGARKYGLGLVIAHQEFRQLWDQSTEVAGSVLANPYTRICFRLGDFDARKLQEGFSFYEAQDLQNLGIGEAICKVERADYDFNLRTFDVASVDEEQARETRKRILEYSRKRYGRSRPEEAARHANVVEGSPPGAVPSSSAEDTGNRETSRKPQEEQQERPKQAPRTPADASPTREVPPGIPPTATGRGGPQHKYLQQLIKRLGEAGGYRAIVKKPVLGGQGSVDVSLERDGRRIACEIGISTTAEHELENIQKCLAAGYEQVVWLSSNRKLLRKVKSLVAADSEEFSSAKLQLLDPEKFVDFLTPQMAEPEGETASNTVCGYRVKVKYQPGSKGDQETRRRLIAKTILKAFQRLK